MADLEKELSVMVNSDFLKHLDEQPEYESGGEYIELSEKFDGNLAEIKEYLISSAAAAVAEEYPFSILSNKGGTNLRDPIELSISLSKLSP